MNHKSLHNASYGKKLNLFLMKIRKRNGFLFLNTLSFKISLKFVTRTMIVCIGVLYKSYKYILKFTRKISPNATKICHFSPQNTFLKVRKSVIITDQISLHEILLSQNHNTRNQDIIYNNFFIFNLPTYFFSILAHDK